MSYTGHFENFLTEKLEWRSGWHRLKCSNKITDGIWDSKILIQSAEDKDLKLLWHVLKTKLFILHNSMNFSFLSHSTFKTQDKNVFILSFRNWNDLSFSNLSRWRNIWNTDWKFDVENIKSQKHRKQNFYSFYAQSSYTFAHPSNHPVLSPLPQSSYAIGWFRVFAWLSSGLRH